MHQASGAACPTSVRKGAATATAAAGRERHSSRVPHTAQNNLLHACCPQDADRLWDQAPAQPVGWPRALASPAGLRGGLVDRGGADGKLLVGCLAPCSGRRSPAFNAAGDQGRQQQQQQQQVYDAGGASGMRCACRQLPPLPANCQTYVVCGAAAQQTAHFQNRMCSGVPPSPPLQPAYCRSDLPGCVPKDIAYVFVLAAPEVTGVADVGGLTAWRSRPVATVPRRACAAAQAARPGAFSAGT